MDPPEKTFQVSFPHQYQLFFLIILNSLVFIVLYSSTFHWLYERYTATDSYYSHGFLVPFISGYFFWRQKNSFKINPHRSSFIGIFLMAAALFIHVLSVYIHVFFVSGFSIFLLAVGVIIYLFGLNAAKKMVFPLLFLLFMFPLPLGVVQAISIPVKSLAMHISVSAASLAGIPILQKGFYIQLSTGTLLIGAPCSGLRSLISFLAMGAIFSYTLKGNVGKKTIILLLSIPIALFSNIFRIFILILISNFWSVETAAPGSWVHDFSGIGVFVFGLFLLFSIWKIVE